MPYLERRLYLEYLLPYRFPFSLSKAHSFPKLQAWVSLLSPALWTIATWMSCCHFKLTYSKLNLLSCSPMWSTSCILYVTNGTMILPSVSVTMVQLKEVSPNPASQNSCLSLLCTHIACVPLLEKISQPAFTDGLLASYVLSIRVHPLWGQGLGWVFLLLLHG